MKSIACFTGVLLLVIASTPAKGANQRDIDAAIKKGVDYLKERNKDKLIVDEHGIGAIALVGLALVEADVPVDHPVVQKITAAVREASYSQSKTYPLALCLLYLDAVEDPADLPLIQMLGVRVMAGQTGDGGWSYDSVPAVTAEDEKRLRAAFKAKPAQKTGSKAPKAVGPPKLHPEVERYRQTLPTRHALGAGLDDNSNTQFAVLAVWVARRNGVPAEESLALIEQRFISSQIPQTGGWPYETGGQSHSPSMHCAGLIGLATAMARKEERRIKMEASRKTPPKGTAKTDPKKDDPKSDDPFYNPPSDPSGKKKGHSGPPLDAKDLAKQRALAGLGSILAEATRGVGNKGLMVDSEKFGNRDLYFLWSLERVGMLYSLDKIGPVDWFDAGSDAIIANQRSDGSWTTKGGLVTWSHEVGTAFAILFLTRSNVAKDLSSKLKKTTELRGGVGASPSDDPSSGSTTSPRKAPDASIEPSGPIIKPLPTPVDNETAKLAAELTKASAAEWEKVLERFRDTKGTTYTSALVYAISQVDGDRKKQARDALADRLTRMTATTLRGMLKARDAELRRGAALACAMKDDKTHIPDLIDLLVDDDQVVVRAVHAGLKSLADKDFGPEAGADKEKRKAAATDWRAWWAKQPKP